MSLKEKLDYRKSGVDLGNYDIAIEEIKEIVNRHNRLLPNGKYVIGGVGGFAGLFNLGQYLRDRGWKPEEDETKQN